MLFKVHTSTQATHGQLVLVNSSEETVLKDRVHPWELSLPPQVSHHLEPKSAGHQGIEASLVIDVALHAILGKALMDAYGLVPKLKIILLDSQIALREHAIGGKDLLKLLSHIEHVLRIVDMRI